MKTDIHNIIVGRSMIITVLDEKLPNLTLTGSYAFGMQKLHSDFDFFTDDPISPSLPYGSVGTVLSSLGFISAENDLYHDDNTITVWRHKYGIDVQIVKDFRIKVMAQVILLQEMCRCSSAREREHWYFVGRLECNDRWNDAYALVRSIIEAMKDSEWNRQ